MNSTRHGADAPAGHRRLPHPRHRDRAPSPPAPAQAPDLAAAAGQAVVRFLRDSSAGLAERDDGQADGAGSQAMPATATAAGNGAGNGTPAAGGIIAAAKGEMPWSAASGAGHLGAESVALRAAAVSVSTLDRIELLAAKLEADIAAAHRAQAELQAGAGAAAAAAVRAAQVAWAAAGTAVEADKRAKISLLKVARYVEVTVALLIVAMIILVVTATSVH